VRVHGRVRPAHGLQLDRSRRPLRLAQPARIGGWNLARLAECLLPLLADDSGAALEDAQAALAAYGPRVTEAYEAGLLRKIGIAAAREGDVALARDLLDAMAVQGADFTLTFRRLGDAAFASEKTSSRPQSQDHEIEVGRGFLNGEPELRRLFKDRPRSTRGSRAGGPASNRSPVGPPRARRRCAG
jgi:uncharacterized protein YdiU (UPF0061 family)